MYKQIELTIVVNEGEQKVIAARKVTDHFAIHKMVNHSMFYAVTHIATGRAVVYGLKREGAIAIARQAERLSIEWDNVDEESRKTLVGLRETLPDGEWDGFISVARERMDESGYWL